MRLLKFLKNRAQRYSFIGFSYSYPLYLKIKSLKVSKRVRILLYLCVSPFVLIKMVAHIIAERTVGSFMAVYRRKIESKQVYKQKLAIVAIAKNEAPYIKEWIEFHKIVGVNKFYIYDNESTDNITEELAPYIESGEVVYTYFPGKSKQLSAYNDAISKYKGENQYLGFVDLDEFLIPSSDNEMLPVAIDAILQQKRHAAGIGVTWRVFGSSGFDKKPDGLVTENYLYRSVDKCWQNYHIKTVCNPRLVKQFVSPHFPIYKLGAWNINENGKRLHAWFPLGQCYSKIKINHYFCKSKEEALQKWQRGLADRNEKYDWKKFEQYDTNDVFDDALLVYTPRLRKLCLESK